MILNSGMRSYFSELNDRIDYGILGTGVPLVTFADTGLDTPVNSTKLEMSSQIVQSPSLIVKEYLLPQSGDANAYAEFGWLNNAEGLYYTHERLACIVKTSANEIPVVGRIQLLRVQ